jgi:hemoglobin
MNVVKQAPAYGQGDASFQAAGMQAGIRKLVDDFYTTMEQHSKADKIRKMHPVDLEESRDKLALFLCGWLGGPKLFTEKYGQISIPKAHAHLRIDSTDRDAWLLCMEQALKSQPYTHDFKVYLLKQLAVPAERCRTVK